MRQRLLNSRMPFGLQKPAVTRSLGRRAQSMRYARLASLTGICAITRKRSNGWLKRKRSKKNLARHGCLLLIRKCRKSMRSRRFRSSLILCVSEAEAVGNAVAFENSLGGCVLCVSGGENHSSQTVAFCEFDNVKAVRRLLQR